MKQNNDSARPVAILSQSEFCRAKSLTCNVSQYNACASLFSVCLLLFGLLSFQPLQVRRRSKTSRDKTTARRKKSTCSTMPWARMAARFTASPVFCPKSLKKKTPRSTRLSSPVQALCASLCVRPKGKRNRGFLLPGTPRAAHCANYHPSAKRRSGSHSNSAHVNIVVGIYVFDPITAESCREKTLSLLRASILFRPRLKARH